MSKSEIIMHCAPSKQLTTVRDGKEKKHIKRRLSVIEGQIRGVQKMVDDERNCEELLTQLSAADHAIKSLAYIILNRHLHSCVVENIEAGNHQVIDEIVDLFKKFTR